MSSLRARLFQHDIVVSVFEIHCGVLQFFFHDIYGMFITRRRRFCLYHRP